ncbi:MAG: hypothetical protein ACFFAU_20050 [Candidatus Hodarchaeota archaeon]
MDGIPKIERAKSSRSTCRTCKQKISKDFYRVGVPYQFTKPDGEEITSYGWYHPECVPFRSITSVLEILNNDLLIDNKDKESIIKSLKNTKKDQEAILRKPFIETSKSSRGKCKECDNKIEKDVYRVAEPSEVELDDGRRFFTNKFYHLECYFKTTPKASTRFNELIDISLKRKSITSRTEAELLEKKLSKILIIDNTTVEVLKLIGEDPMEIDTLKVLTKEKGIDFESVKKVIEKELLQGTLFEPAPGLIQKI